MELFCSNSLSCSASPSSGCQQFISSSWASSSLCLGILSLNESQPHVKARERSFYCPTIWAGNDNENNTFFLPGWRWSISDCFEGAQGKNNLVERPDECRNCQMQRILLKLWFLLSKMKMLCPQTRALNLWLVGKAVAGSPKLTLRDVYVWEDCHPPIMSDKV